MQRLGNLLHTQLFVLFLLYVTYGMQWVQQEKNTSFTRLPQMSEWMIKIKVEYAFNQLTNGYYRFLSL